MNAASDLSFYLAFAAGLFSFLSPCVLPLFPSYLAFITGLSFEELTHNYPKRRLRQNAVVHSLLFIMGFSALFISLGASATLLGQFLAAYRDTIRIAGGILVILFGLFTSGVLSLEFLQQEKKFHFRDKPLGFLGTFLVGVGFAAGWTPCVGPILSSILLYASTAGEMRSGILLLLFYSLGMGLPFLVCSLALNIFLTTFHRTRGYLGVLRKIGGLFLIAVGILLLTDSLSFLNEVVTWWFPALM